MWGVLDEAPLSWPQLPPVNGRAGAPSTSKLGDDSLRADGPSPVRRDDGPSLARRDDGEATGIKELGFWFHGG